MEIDAFLYKNRNYIFLPFILIGILLSRPSYDLLVFGLILVGVGELFRLMGMSYTGADSRDFNKENTNLVTNGIYAHIRNPVLTGNMFILFGAIIGLNGWQPFLLWLAIFTVPVLYHFIARYEENILAEMMGESYEVYFQAVPRFYPKIIPFRQRSKFRLNFTKAVQSDKEMIAGIVIVGALFALHWYLFSI